MVFKYGCGQWGPWRLRNTGMVHLQYFIQCAPVAHSVKCIGSCTENWHVNLLDDVETAVCSEHSPHVWWQSASEPAADKSWLKLLSRLKSFSLWRSEMYVFLRWLWYMFMFHLEAKDRVAIIQSLKGRSLWQRFTAFGFHNNCFSHFTAIRKYLCILNLFLSVFAHII